MAARKASAVALILIALFFTGSLASAPEDFPLARPVQEAINVQEIERLERQFADGSLPADEVIRLAGDLIGQYTGQFREKRRNDRRALPVPERLADLNADLVRLMQIVRNRETGAGFFYERSPYMQRLYVLLGQAYEAKKEPVRALSAYTTALRYGAFERPHDDPERAREQDRARLREEIYHAIANGMGDADRLTQEPDAQIRQAGAGFAETLRQFRQLRLDVEEARRLIYVEEAKQLRGGGDPATARANYERLRGELEQTEQSLEAVRLGIYKTYYERESAAGGELLHKMALLSKEIETSLRLQERVLNRSSYYRGTGNVLGEERTVLRDFVGYRALLELAHRLNPRRAEYVQLLAEEYRTGRDLPRAIMYYELVVDLVGQPGGQSTQGLALSYIRLAGLYADRQNYIRSVQTYERLFARTEPDLWQGVKERLRDQPSTRSLADLLDIQTTFRLHLADLMFEKTGPLNRAKNLYEQSLSELRQIALPDEAEYLLRQAVLRRQYEVLLRLAAIERRGRQSEAESRLLAEALQIGRRLEEESGAALTALQSIDRQRADVSAQLKIGPEEQELSQRFYRLSYVERPIAAEKEASYRSTVQALDLPQILERQAYLAVRARDLNTARPLYLEMIQKGRGDQATRARQNLELLSEGPAALRRLKLPPDFER
ncbi:hypothetical protein [Leptonema illini]|uniref:Tetratricopeptide repeat protein n=1 Tax=Leptonema illini DSM 21528 TaxID=929563 RepID=H2CDZ4_9LEPT|nr:hypothetical protein [Leptonema illini]EHQ05513.1 hypothetical protein Lepil_0812 [Leptonema illini DSM 21528]